jgi:hypothetical protein
MLFCKLHDFTASIEFESDLIFPCRSVINCLSAAAAGQNPGREVSLFHWLEFLDSSAPVGLGHINIAFGIDRQSVAMGKRTDLVTRTPEARENFSAGMVENLDLFVAAVVYVHVFLFPVGRKADPPCSAPIIWKAAVSLDPNVVLEISHLIEDLDPVALPVTDIDQAVIADDHTMHNLHERATHTRFGLFFCPLVPPLTKEFPGSIENSYAIIAVTVSHVDVAIAGIYRYVGRHVELRVTRIQCPALESAVGSIDNASLADLHE